MALLSAILGFPILRILRSCEFDHEEPEPGTLGEGLRRAAAMPRLAASVHAKQPAKFLTKDELRSVADARARCLEAVVLSEVIMAIEDSGRYDCYEPLRRRLRTKSLPVCYPRRCRPTALPRRRFLSPCACRHGRAMSPIGGQSGKHMLDLRLTAFEPKADNQGRASIPALAGLCGCDQSRNSPRHKADSSLTSDSP